LSDEDIEELKKAHELIRKVYAIMPELLLNVLPQLQDEMLSEDDNVRDVVTETIGQMFADSQSHLMEQYPGLWREWLGRRNDKSLRLRLKWLDMVEEVAVRHPDLVSEINGKSCHFLYIYIYI
jgi:sister-chromatid-cohesion protein PDS5